MAWEGGHRVAGSVGQVVGSLAQAIAFLGFPAVAIWGSKRNRVIAWLSPVVACYVFGIVLGNVGLVPDPGLATTFTEVTVLLAIPLLLFGADFRAWMRLAPRTVLSFGFAIIAVVLAAVLGAALLPTPPGEGWKIAGMTVGVYTGGTPNLNAIGVAVDVRQSTLVLLNSADLLLGAVYLLFLMTVAQRVLLRFLPAFRRTAAVPLAGGAGDDDPDGTRSMPARHVRGPGTPAAGEGGPGEGGSGEGAPRASGAASEGEWAFMPSVSQVVRALGAAVVVGVAAAGIALLLTGELSEALVILAITTLGVAGSFVPRVRDLPGTYEVGQYLFLVFAVAIGSQARISELVDSFSSVFLYLGPVLLASILLHLLLAALFRIDADTVIITSTAAVYGPPFVGPIAQVLGNREVVVSGMTTGVIGLALGNYAGLAVAYLLQ